MKTKLPLLLLLLFISKYSLFSQTLYDVVLGTDNVPVTEVQFEFNGNTITQTSGFGTAATPTANRTTLPVSMNYIKIDIGGGNIVTLDFFNALGSFVTNNNFTAAAKGVGVYNEGVKTEVKNGVVAWEEAMQDMVNSRNALHYLYYDGVSGIPSGDDFDILFKKALTDDDHLVVSERFGNTFFTVTPLDINGNPITSARKLRFGFVQGPNNGGGSTTGNGSRKYDWNIGYGSAGQNGSQPQYFSVVDVELFNSTSPIYGFRIDNNGEADVKFYGIADNTFIDNPTNPIVPGITGNIFNDIDKLNNNTVDGSGISTPNGTQLYVSLLYNGNIVSTVSINSDGSYEFLDNVDDNTNYTIVLHTNPAGSTTPSLPTNWVNIGENQGVAPGNDGNINGIITVSVGVVLETQVNFGIVENLGSIGDTVWYDTNGDGLVDAGELGLEGATVTLDPGTTGNPTDDLVTTTDANGNYSFSNLSAGSYTVTLDVSTVTSGLPMGVTAGQLSQTFDADGIGTANSSSFTLTIGENNTVQDFGYQKVSNSCTDGAILGTPTADDPDGDGINNICDEDDDNDGILDINEYVCTNAPLGSVDSFIIENESQTLKSVNVSSFSDSNNPFAPNTNFTLNYGVSNGKRLEGISFSSGKTVRVDPVAKNGTVHIRRNTGSSNPNNEIIWMENDGHTSSTNAKNLHIKQVTSMEESFSHGYYNVGSDNVFNNNASSTNKNNVERIDVIFDNGYQVISAENQFITVGERGKNNFIDIAVVTSISTNGTPTSFSNVYRVNTNTMETVEKIPSTVLRKEATDTNFRPSTALNQDVAIRVVKLSEFGITDGSSIYGFSILPPDYNTSNILDWTTYPTNTNENIGGLDLVLFNYFSSDCLFEDTDKDGIPNTEDPDSDGDGCPDVLESGGTDTNNDGVLDGTSIDANGKVVGGNGGYDGASGNEYVAHQLNVTMAPTDVTANSGSSASFTVFTSAESATNYNNGTPIYAVAGNADSSIQYQWYIGDPNNGGTQLSDAGIYSNTTTATLNVSDITGLDGTVYYVVVTHTDNICSRETESATLNVTPLGSIGDTVWFDTDGDGLVDAGEPRLEGATVTLDPGTPGNAADDLTTTTDANGNYLFDNLTAGTYTITVDVSTVTNGIPAGKTFADLIQTFDADGLSTPNTSSITLAQGEDNLDQDFAYNVTTSGGTTGGNDGGVESESLGDAISKIYIGRKKNSIPTEFVKDASNRYNKVELQAKQPYQGKGQTMLDMFPEELVAGDQANVTSPTDILDYTIADEVLSVDFSLDGETKGVVLGIKTSDRVYNHTKASCDRLRGAEILNVMPLKVAGYNFLMQGIKQRNGEVEYAVSFAASKNNNDTNYSIQANWYVNNYTKFNDMYNFQVWATDPQNTKKLVADIISNLQSFIPVKQVAKETNVPKTYASKVYRDKAELVIDLRSTDEGKTAEIDMVELYSETANNIKHRHEQVDTKIQQSLRVDIADGYEYDATIEVTDTIQDAFYHADGNWGLDYDGRYTEIKEYFVYNNFDREYLDDEYTISRDVVLQATSDYDYLTLYKSLLPGTISADYSAYKYLSFKAKGSGLIELGLVKASITDWKEQYKVMVDLSEEERTYYIPFEIFSSIGTEAEIVADDLTTLTFTWLPVEANTTELDLEISDVKFTKEAVEDLTVGKIETFENEFLAYPNPSLGNVTTMLFSEEDTEVTVTLTDVTGKTIYKATKEIIRGKNELEFNFNVKPGVLFLKVASDEIDYGTSKIIFR